MENQCKNCMFRDEIYENDFIKLDDKEYNEKLFCPAYSNGIPKDVLNDKEKCMFKINEDKK